jgi:NAD(P)-dependent dehydrogenase (short-subunit alcohol dehydrogenase family)
MSKRELFATTVRTTCARRRRARAANHATPRTRKPGFVACITTADDARDRVATCGHETREAGISMRLVVTGANRGLGLGLARLCGARGDEVWATARRPAEATALAALARASNGRVHVHALDLRDDAQVAALAAALGDSPVDVLVNNAGVAGAWRAGLADFDAAEALATFDINALGAIRMTRALMANLRAARGKVVNMTSLMGSIADNGSGRAYAYRMSKAALNMATSNFAHELRGFGGVAIALHPGWVKTDMGGAGALEEVDDVIARIVDKIDRMGPDDSGRFWHAKGQELPW